MREIKFRAWNKPTNEMNYYVEHYTYADGSWGCSAGTNNNPIGNSENFILMQYTGLKDKNGKEIYEGDIIRIKHPFKDRNFEGTVEFMGHHWNCKDFYFTHFDSPGDLLSEGTEYIEIIGNIYENPIK